VSESSEAARIDREIEQAFRLRAEGRLGRARVCCRRAAGWAVGPLYFGLTGLRSPANAMTLLRWYRDLAGAPEPLRQAAGRLTTHVTQDHALPHPEDPVEDARALIEALRSGQARPVSD
jgi:hypothetical protein